MNQGAIAWEQCTLSNGWRYNRSPVEERLPASAIEEALIIIDRWTKVFPSKGTWAGDTWGVPSFAIRFEGVYSPKGGWKVFEIEDRPCGLGASPEVNPFMAKRLAELRPEWPAFRWVIDPDRNTDDGLWLGPGLTLSEALASGGLLLARSRPEKKEYHPLEPRAVSTVSQEGNKRPLVELGLARIVRWVFDHTEQAGGYISPSVPGPCVVKPVQATRCRNVTVYLNGCDYIKVGREKVPALDGVPIIKTRGDSVGLERLEKLVREMGEALCQPLHMPMRLGHTPGHNAIYRFFFGYSPKRGRYVPLGGVWNASKSLRVHGEDGVVFGPLVFEE